MHTGILAALLQRRQHIVEWQLRRGSTVRMGEKPAIEEGCRMFRWSRNGVSSGISIEEE